MVIDNFLFIFLGLVIWVVGFVSIVRGIYWFFVEW